MGKIIRSTLLLLGFVSLWQVCVLKFDLPNYILPPPTEVITAFYRYHAIIITHLWPTLFETLMGFVLGVLLGMVMAITLGYFKRARLWFLPLVLVSQALPTFAIAPLLVIWLGYGEASKIMVCILMLFFPVTSSFYDGLHQTPQGYLDLAKVMNASRWTTLWRIRIPAALPALGSGLRLAATFAPMGAIIGEWVGSSRGLGFLMLNANSRMQIDMMFAVILVVIFLTLLLYYLVDQTLRWIIFYK